MAASARTGLAVALTAIVTAVLTSLVWLLIFNLREETPRPAASVPDLPPPLPGLPPETPSGGNDVEILAARRLTIPVAGVEPSMLQDSFADARGGGARGHDALDIMAPHGTPVVAVEDGRIAKLFNSEQGGLTIYQFDPTGTYAYYYAHLASYVEGLMEGQAVRRGQLLGAVGATGNASPYGPHLHFAIFRLGPEKRWHEGAPINPYPILGGNPQGSRPVAPATRAQGDDMTGTPVHEPAEASAAS